MKTLRCKEGFKAISEKKKALNTLSNKQPENDSIEDSPDDSSLSVDSFVDMISTELF